MPYATFVSVKGENTGLYHAVASLSWFALLNRKQRFRPPWRLPRPSHDAARKSHLTTAPHGRALMVHHPPV